MHMLYTRILLLFFMIILFVTCKKTLTNGENSKSSVKYFKGGLNDKVNFISGTNDGGFIYCGYTGLDSGKVDAFLMKVNSSGAQEWYKTYGGEHYDEFRHVLPLADGGFLAVGMTNSIGRGSTDGTYRLFDYTVKVNATGNEVWSKSYSNQQAVLQASYETTDHTLLITGANSVTDNNVMLVKLDASGNLIYLKYYAALNALPPLHISNNYNEFARFVSLDEKGAVLIGGTMSKSGFASEAGTLVPFIMKANYSTGGANYLMTYYSYQSGTNYQLGFSSPHLRKPWVKVLNLNDGYLIGTYIELPGPVMKMQLIKTDFSCNEIWEKEYSGLGNSILYNLDVNPDGTFLISGTSTKEQMNSSAPEGFFSMKTAILNIDKDGTEIWSSYIGNETNSNQLKALRRLDDGSMIGAGYSCSSETGYDQMFFMQLDKAGNLK
jgi:hypothetical protein